MKKKQKEQNLKENEIKNTSSLKKKEANQIDMEMKDKYYRKFDFFYRRTAFRTMTEYYKGLFRPNLERWRDIEKKNNHNPSSTITS